MKMENLRTTLTPLKDIKSGDTVRINGVLRTVCQKDLGYSSFMGVSLFGATFPRVVERVEFIVPTNFGIVYR